MDRFKLMNHSAAIAETNTGIPNGKLGIWVFLASEVMLFGGFIGWLYLVLRGKHALNRRSQLLDSARIARLG